MLEKLRKDHVSRPVIQGHPRSFSRSPTSQYAESSSRLEVHLSTIIRFKVPDILAPSNIQGFPCFFRTLEAVVGIGTRNLRKGSTEEKSFVTDEACSVWTFANALVRRILQGGVLGRA